MLRTSSSLLMLSRRSVLASAPRALLASSSSAAKSSSSSSSGSGNESYSDRMAKTGRPLSPHVDIYKFPPAAISSIMNRVTGAAMWGGFSLVSSLALVGVDVASHVNTLGSIPVIGFASKFAVAFSVSYHYMGALRHMYWDNKPEALETADVTKLSYAIIGTSAVVSTGIALL